MSSYKGTNLSTNFSTNFTWDDVSDAFKSKPDSGRAGGRKNKARSSTQKANQKVTANNQKQKAASDNKKVAGTETPGASNVQTPSPKTSSAAVNAAKMRDKAGVDMGVGKNSPMINPMGFLQGLDRQAATGLAEKKKAWDNAGPPKPPTSDVSRERRAAAAEEWASKQGGTPTPGGQDAGPDAVVVPTSSRPEMTDEEYQSLTKRDANIPQFDPETQSRLDRANAILDKQKEYGRQTQERIFEDEVTAMGQRSDAFMRENDRQLDNIAAKNKALLEGQANWSEFGSLQDAQKFAAPDNRIGENTGKPGVVNYDGFLESQGVTPGQLARTRTVDTLAGRPIDAPPPEYSELERIARGEGPGAMNAADILSRQNMTEQDRQANLNPEEQAQKEILDRILADKSIASPEMKNGKYVDREERRAIGDQYKKNAREARLRGTTPEAIANERKMLEVSGKTRQAELDAQRSAKAKERIQSNVDTFKQTVKGHKDQLEIIDDQLKALGDGPAQGEDEKAHNERVVQLQQQREQLYGQLKQDNALLHREQNRLAVSDVNFNDVSIFQRISKDPNMAEAFKMQYGIYPDQWFNEKYAPGTYEALQRAYGQPTEQG